MNAYDQLRGLVQRIEDRGVNATLDPRNVHPPCALVSLGQLGSDNTLCGDYDVTALVMLIAPDQGMPTAIPDLLTMYDKVSDLTTGAEPSTFTWSDMGTLPALTLNDIPLEE